MQDLETASDPAAREAGLRAMEAYQQRALRQDQAERDSLRRALQAAEQERLRLDEERTEPATLGQQEPPPSRGPYYLNEPADGRGFRATLPGDDLSL
jgi:hypothetical protein